MYMPTHSYRGEPHTARVCVDQQVLSLFASGVARIRQLLGHRYQYRLDLAYVIETTCCYEITTQYIMVARHQNSMALYTGFLSAFCSREGKMRLYGLLGGQAHICVQSMWQTRGYGDMLPWGNFDFGPFY